MTILNCSATTCVYNKNQLCSRGGIEVTGSEAPSRGRDMLRKLPGTGFRFRHKLCRGTVRMREDRYRLQGKGVYL